MITLNGQTWVRTKREAVESLFTAGPTVSGFYKRMKGGVLFSDLKGDPVAFLVLRPGDDPFLVTAFRQENGRLRYMYAMTKASERHFGLENAGYRAERDAAMNMARQVDPMHRALAA